jgi:hypothetical protein
MAMSEDTSYFTSSGSSRNGEPLQHKLTRSPTSNDGVIGARENGAVQPVDTTPARGVEQIIDTPPTTTGSQESRFSKSVPNRFYNNNHFDGQSENGRNGRNFHQPSAKYAATGMAHRNSHSWLSPENQHMQEFLVIRNSMRRLFKHSDVSKWKFDDYIAHKQSIVESKKRLLAAKIKIREEEEGLKVPARHAGALESLMARIPNNNYGMEPGRSRVLNEKTIWCEGWEAEKEEVAPWPTYAELKWEGDDRAKTGVGRYPPLPRENGAAGIPWNQLQALEQHPLDCVGRIPTMEDVYLPVDEIDDGVKHNLITKDLEIAMDNYLDS